MLIFAHRIQNWCLRKFPKFGNDILYRLGVIAKVHNGGVMIQNWCPRKFPKFGNDILYRLGVIAKVHNGGVWRPPPPPPPPPSQWRVILDLRKANDWNSFKGPLNKLWNFFLAKMSGGRISSGPGGYCMYAPTRNRAVQQPPGTWLKFTNIYAGIYILQSVGHCAHWTDAEHPGQKLLYSKWLYIMPTFSTSRIVNRV